MHVIQGCWRLCNILRSLLTQPEWTPDMCYKLPSTMKTETPHEQWRMKWPLLHWQSPGSGLVWPTLLLGWRHRQRKSFLWCTLQRENPWGDVLSDQVSKNESEESVSSFSIPQQHFGISFFLFVPYLQTPWTTFVTLYCINLSLEAAAFWDSKIGEKQIKTKPNISGGYICRPGLSFHHEPICLQDWILSDHFHGNSCGLE